MRRELKTELVTSGFNLGLKDILVILFADFLIIRLEVESISLLYDETR